ncbi:MAG: hypothetical protein WBN36_13590, partial [Gammaproteobacteria bacterium]
LQKRHSGPFICSFSLRSVHYAPQKNRKLSSPCHFFATGISTAQTPSAKKVQTRISWLKAGKPGEWAGGKYI